MSKPKLGLIIGGVLGLLDGLTMFFYPDLAPLMTIILVGSTFKGLVAGVLIGVFARRVKSFSLGILFGVGVSLFLAFLTVMVPNPDGSGSHHWMEIMVPGAVIGAILGYATQKYGHGQISVK